MSKAIVLNEKLDNSGEAALPESFQGINAHNLYLYTKAYLANIRSATANTKTRSEVSGGGKKPFAQKGGGRARQGSIRAVQFKGGGIAHGPRSNRNYTQKINKKQQFVALKFAINAKAEAGKLMLADSISVPSGKTKDAAALVSKVADRDVLVVTDSFNFAEEAQLKTFLAFRNIKNAYLIEASELDAYLVSTYHSVLMNKSVFENLTKEG